MPDELSAELRERYQEPNARLDAQLRAAGVVGLDGSLPAWLTRPPRETRADVSVLQRRVRMSFVHWCVASMMRIVPDFERITRLCVLAPSPQ